MIAGRTPAAAARSLRAVLQQAVSCVSTGVFVEGPRGPTSELLLTSRLGRTTAGGQITLTIEHRYGLVHDASAGTRAAWQAQTAGYLHTLDDADGREIIAYHWHPAGRSPVRLPHVHLGAGAGTLRPELEKAHVETGIVTPAALLTLIIEQFGVRPRRSDWAAVLAQARRALAGP